jgi:hypothetical protein
VANHYHTSRIAEQEPETLLAGIHSFLASCKQPAVLEPGEETIPLIEGQYALEIRSGRLSIEIWTQTRSISRRILEILNTSTGIVDCQVHRFGGREGKLSFIDLAKPQTAHRKLVGTRQNFGEQFRRMLARQFPGWNIATLTVAQDLRRSFSSIYPRAHLTRGRQHIAALACPDAEAESHMLAFALIWQHHIRSTSDADFSTRLALFLPHGCGNQTAHRLRWLNRDRLQPLLFLFNEHGSAGEVDPADLGNLDTRVAAQSVHPAPQTVIEPASERWLEQVVRSSIQRIDPQLRLDPIHNQVLSFAAADRDLIDLLAVTQDGRLCVLELKVTEDLQLPIQALDYWMRINWHVCRQELTHLFPRIHLLPVAPRLILLAPALSFHSSTATLLRYFSSQIEVERVGVNTDWRSGLKITMRLLGAANPASH